MGGREPAGSEAPKPDSKTGSVNVFDRGLRRRLGVPRGIPRIPAGIASEGRSLPGSTVPSVDRCTPSGVAASRGDSDEEIEAMLAAAAKRKP